MALQGNGYCFTANSTAPVNPVEFHFAPIFVVLDKTTIREAGGRSWPRDSLGFAGCGFEYDQLEHQIGRSMS